LRAAARKTGRGLSGRGAPLGALAAIALLLPATAQASQTLSVEKAGSGTGTITSSPAGIDCGGTCSLAFADGTLVLLSGIAGPNSTAVAWSGCESVTIENKCKVTMGSPKTVKATFGLIKRKLSIEKTGSGSGTITSSPAGINCGSTCSAEYEHGTEVTLSATPGPFTEAAKWSGCESVSPENKCKVTMASAKSVSASFSLHPVSLKVKPGGLGTGTVSSAPAGISCGATCTASFGEGQTVTLTGTPTGKTEAVKWSGCDAITAEGKCQVTMAGAREVGAVFDLEGPTLSVAITGPGTGTVTSAPTALECPAACAVNFPEGSKVTLSAIRGLHSEAAKWTGCDEVSKENKCIVTMSSARQVSAAFELEPQYVQYALSIAMPGPGQGTVTSIPGGISCSPDCSQEFVLKTKVTLIATPAPGSEFDHWSATSCGEATLCSLTVNNERTLNAVFRAIGTRTLSVAKAGSGQGAITSKPQAIECGSSCSAQLDAKTKVTLHAVPTPGSTFSGWSGDCSGTKACHVQMNEARNVTATFTSNSPSPQAKKCRVPRLKGKTLAKAKRALSRAHCKLGKLSKPKGKGALLVASSKPGKGATRPAGTRVKVKLVRKQGR
jgi:hypothetical protein